jgi:hypothetical protein
MKTKYTITATIPKAIAEAGRGYHWQTGIPNRISFNDNGDHFAQWHDRTSDQAEKIRDALTAIGVSEVNIDKETHAHP